MLDREVFEGFGMGRLNHLLIVVYGQHPPTDEERRHYINYLRTYPDLPALRILIYTLGGAPTAAQRKESNQLVRQLKLEDKPAALLMEGILPKMAMRELSPVQRGLQTFSRHDVEGAMAYLKPDGVTVEAAHEALNDLCVALSLEPPGG